MAPPSLEERRRKNDEATRKVFAGFLAAFALMFGYVTLTIPAIAATAPALLTIAFAVGAYLVWPRERRS